MLFLQSPLSSVVCLYAILLRCRFGSWSVLLRMDRQYSDPQCSQFPTYSNACQIIYTPNLLSIQTHAYVHVKYTSPCVLTSRSTNTPSSRASGLIESFLSLFSSSILPLSACRGFSFFACPSGFGRWVHGKRSNRVVFTR